MYTHSKNINKPYSLSKNNKTPKTQTKYGIKTISFEGAQLYNSLPLNVLNSKSLNIFKKRLRTHILDDFTDLV